MIFVRQKEKERLFPDSTIMAAINTRKESRTGYLFRAERGEPPRGREARRPSTDPLRTRPCPVAVGRDVLIAPPSARAANPRTALARVHSARALPCGAIGISRPTGHAAPSHTHRATRPCPVSVGRDDRLSGLPTRAANPRTAHTRVSFRHLEKSAAFLKTEIIDCAFVCKALTRVRKNLPRKTGIRVPSFRLQCINLS